MSLHTWAPGPHFKTKTIKKVKGRRKRAERKVIQSVRPACVKRDGFCLARDVSTCEGKSEWAHAEDRRRSRTMGSKNDPEYRHATAHSGMLCTKHHEQYDGKRQPRLTIYALQFTRGWDGTLRLQEDGRDPVWRERG